MINKSEEISKVFEVKLNSLLDVYQSGIPKVWLEKPWCHELLLIIASLNGNPNLGVRDYLKLLQTKKCSIRTYTLFIQDRIADGDLIQVHSTKKSQKAYRLSDPLLEILSSSKSSPNRKSLRARQNELALEKINLI
jgi:hypothetical protein